MRRGARLAVLAAVLLFIALALFGSRVHWVEEAGTAERDGYVAQAEKIKAKGIDQIVCLSVNDAFVMGAWGKDQKVGDKVSMLGDGSGLWSKSLGLELDLIEKGLGVRCQRFSMLVEDGVVKSLDVEAPGKFEVSDAQSMLNRL